jgi:hypothetical protein
MPALACGNPPPQSPPACSGLPAGPERRALGIWMRGAVVGLQRLPKVPDPAVSDLPGLDGPPPPGAKKGSTKLASAQYRRKGEVVKGLRGWIEDYGSRGWPKKKVAKAAAIQARRHSSSPLSTPHPHPHRHPPPPPPPPPPPTAPPQAWLEAYAEIMQQKRLADVRRTPPRARRAPPRPAARPPRPAAAPRRAAPHLAAPRRTSPRPVSRGRRRPHMQSHAISPL